MALLDINLRGTASYPIAEILAKRSIPFVFVSGYSRKGIDPRFVGVPSLQKPFTAEALDEVLARTLAAQ